MIEGLGGGVLDAVVPLGSRRGVIIEVRVGEREDQAGAVAGAVDELDPDGVARFLGRAVIDRSADRPPDQS